MKEPDSSDNGEGAIDFSEIVPDQFIVTDKELDQALYEQFMTEQEWINPQPDYTILVRQGKELSGSTMPISEKKRILMQLASWGTALIIRLLQHSYQAVGAIREFINHFLKVIRSCTAYQRHCQTAQSSHNLRLISVFCFDIVLFKRFIPNIVICLHPPMTADA